MSFWRWSKTSASNATADPSINFAEGQAPSSINDSARALMAAAAKYRDDVSGAIVTGGTPTAYTVASNQVFDTLAHMDGAMIAFTPNAVNGATVTLNVDSLGAKPLRFGPSSELPTGSLVTGTPYVATYNNTDGVFYLQGGFVNPYNVPLSSGMDYWGPTAPNSAFAFPFHQAVSRTTYATLFSLIGTTYGVGDGSTTFNLPDKRGCVSAGKDDMGGTSAGRLTPSGIGLTLGVIGGEALHTLTSNEIPPITPVGDVAISDPGHPHSLTATFASSSGAGSSLFTTSNTVGDKSIQGGTAVSNTTGITASFTGQAQGGGGAHQNVQPTIVCNYIIRII